MGAIKWSCPESRVVRLILGRQDEVSTCVCARVPVWRGKSLGSEGTVQLSDGHQHARRAPQGRLQSQDLGKHLTGVEDLLQLHELVEADIAVQAERVRAVSASALRFCDPGKGDSGGRDWDREGLRRTVRAEAARWEEPGDRKGDGWFVGGRVRSVGWWGLELGGTHRRQRAGPQLLALWCDLCRVQTL